MTGQTIMDQMKEREEVIEKVRSRFPEVKFPDPILEPIYFGRKDKTIVIGKKLIMDRETGQQWDVVSDKYSIKFHEEVVDDLMKAMPQEYGKPEIKFGFLFEKARMDITTLFPEAATDINGSKIKPMIRLKNSYNRTIKVVFEFGAEEQICTNGLVAFKLHEKNTAKHIQGALTQLELEQKIKDSLSTFSEQKKLWQCWAQKKLDNLMVTEAVEALPFSEKESEALLMLPLMNHNKDSVRSLLEKGKATLWNLNSAATQMAKHQIASESRRVDLETDIAKVMTVFYDKIK